ncbi:MAG: spinster family MFS transporter [Hyphomonadaceae bacterium]
MSNPSDAHRPSPARFTVLGLLFVVYCFNFIDRQIVGVLAAPMQEDLNLTDTQLGLLGGLAFAIFYTGLGIPIAWLADRWSRTWIMTIALSVWSAMTALCGMAQNFTQLFAARVGVGVGEAGGVAPAYSLVSDYFPPHERARAFAVYSFGIPVGSAAGVALGGVLASLVDWRWAFIAVGLAGLLVAPVFRAFVREPERGRFDAKVEQPKAATLGELARTIFPKPSFWLLSFGAASSSIMSYGAFFWMPSFLIRSYEMSLRDASLFYAAVLLIGGLIGVWLGGLAADKLGARRKGAYAAIPAIAFALSAPCYAVGLLVQSPAIAFVFFLLPTALGLAWLGPIITAVQHLAPATMRTTASALFLFINNLIGLGAGTLVIGALSDALTARFGEEALRYSILAGSGFYIIAAAFFGAAAMFLKRNWVD